MHVGMISSNKRMKTKAYYTSVKEKAATAPSTSLDNSSKSMSSHLHWKEYFFHMINNTRFKEPTQPKAGAEGLKYDSSNKG
jgi:hypothetical protein